MEPEAAVTIRYATEPDLSRQEFVDVLARSTLGQRRPLDDAKVMEGMLRTAQVVLTARTESGQLVGVARALTDFAFCTYLSELAVDEAFQRRGIGKQLLQRAHEAAGLHTHLILIAAPGAESYYPHIGMTPRNSCWMTAGRRDAT